MISNNPDRIAFETAKEIVVARMANAEHRIDEATGELVGEYFEAIYNKLLEIAKSGDE